MSMEVDWQITEEGGEVEQVPREPVPRWVRWAVVAAFVLVGLVMGFVWWRLYSVEVALRESVQRVLDIEHEAFLAGEGELFFSVYEDDLAFQSAQLHPEQQVAHAAGWRVTNAELHEELIWATLTSEVKGVRQQRIAFFKETDRGLTHMATDPTYWGEPQTRRLASGGGTLEFWEADAPWAEQMATTIAETIETARLEEVPPFSVLIRQDFQVSISPNTISYPSPQIAGLDANGEPSAEYWAGLEAAIAARFEPVTIRYALPSSTTLNDGIINLFDRLADKFTSQYAAGNVSIELVLANDLADEPQTWLPTVDAAFYAPTEQLIKQGMIYNLSSFATQDATFDRADHYDQAWRGVWWRERMWAVPWSMSINLLYFDKEVFREHGLPEPAADWSWEELSPVLAQIDLSESDDKAFVDGARDTLFAIAYSYDAACTSADCVPRLTQAGVLAALEWYEQLVAEEQTMADLGNLSPAQRLQAVRRTQSAHKQNAMWVDSVINYEYQLVLQPTGLLPFLPVSPDKPLAMPIHVQSHIMSQHTKNPYWTWQWLNFLSHQTPLPRQIPARPTVARQSDFWTRLPPALADIMQTVTTHARPVMIGDENYFTWQQLARVANQTQPLQNAAKPAPSPWFIRP
ncbi:MAG: ABC transporter substrate-binding protein [Ardenticatenaceae bacterium]